MLDLKITNSLVVDGSGRPSFRADIGVKDDKIVAIGDLTNAEALRVIDATGLVAAPGFIDIHSHNDFVLPAHNLGIAGLRQGITTAVTGNCGQSSAPTRNSAAQLARKRQAAVAELPDVSWSSFDEYLQMLEGCGTGINVAGLVGHGTLRNFVMGEEGQGGEKTLPTPTELEQLKEQMAEAMQAGAFGLSTGLEYPPGRNARTPELIELCKVVAEHGGIYSTHMRSEGQAPQTELFGAVVEALEIGLQSGAAVNISHLKADQRSIWWKMPVVHRLLTEARQRGQQVTVDLYPYRHAAAGYLYEVLPAPLYKEGLSALLKSLACEEMRQEVAAQLVKGMHGWTNPALTFGWGSIGIIESNCEAAVGNSVEDVAIARGVDPLTACLELLLEDRGLTRIGMAARSEENIVASLQLPFAMISTDSASTDSFPLPNDEDLPAAKLHPRDVGTYPRLFGRYVREQKVLSLEEAVRKCTSLPAQTLGIVDRGTIALGYHADLVIFDLATIAEVGTYSDPHHYPVGITHVLVNGQPAIADGVPTNQMAGKVLRHKA